MNLLIDIGNTAVKIGITENNKIINIYKKCYNLLYDYLEEIFSEKKIEIISLSTVKYLDNKIIELIKNNCNKFINVNANSFLPIKIKYTTPETLGADRICALAGVYSLFPNENILVIDIGTAITYDLLSSDNEYLGGNISLGFKIRTKALNKYTAKLPLVDLVEDFPIIGDSTKHALQSGIIIGIINEIKGYIEKYHNFRVVFTGGDAIYFAKKMKTPIFVDCNLVLNGLNKIIEINA